ncbi:MAG TPA: glycosyltransferase family 2 protein [Bryobacteraceae bacterium]
MTVAAIVPHWNRRDLLAALLESLSRQTRPFHHVIVADNGSTDDSAEFAEQAGACVLRLGKNLGFAAAVNRGIEATRCDWVAILNNDVTLDAHWLARLLESAGLEQAAFATGKILSSARRNLIDGCFDEIARSGCAYRCGVARADSPVWNQPRRIRLAPMTAVLFRRSVFDRVGLLDERFESYLEDVDFGIRCSVHGLGGIYNPEAVAYHRGSATLGQWNKDTVRRLSRNQMYLRIKYLQAQPRWPVMVGQLLWGLLAFRHGCFPAYLRGKIEGLRLSAEPNLRFPEQTAGQGLAYEQTWAPEAVRVLLEESERTILDLQQQTGFDLYWRLYFWLSRRSS